MATYPSRESDPEGADPIRPIRIGGEVDDNTHEISDAV